MKHQPDLYEIDRRYAWHHKRWVVRDGRLVSKMDMYPVILMARCGKWAMVRRPRCLPFVTDIDSLTNLRA